MSGFGYHEIGQGHNRGRGYWKVAVGISVVLVPVICFPSTAGEFTRRLFRTMFDAYMREFDSENVLPEDLDIQGGA